MEHITRNKKGVSMVELIAYVALYGVVMSLLASLVFVIIQSARKVNGQAILNRGATIMYTEILSQTSPKSLKCCLHFFTCTFLEN